MTITSVHLSIGSAVSLRTNLNLGSILEWWFTRAAGGHGQHNGPKPQPPNHNGQPEDRLAVESLQGFHLFTSCPTIVEQRENADV
jgi:hypothetical protein